MPSPRFLLVALLAAGSIGGATTALAQTGEGEPCEETCSSEPAPPDYYTASPTSDDLYKVLDRGQPFSCEAADCAITAKITVSKAVAKYLHLSSRVIASGNPSGPQTVVIGQRRVHDVFILKLPSSLKKKVKARHVVTMQVTIRGTATFTNRDGTPGHSSFPDPDDLSKVSWGQGTRYGCRPVAGGDIIIGYEHIGQTCPK